MFNRSYTHNDVLTRASMTIQVIEDAASYKAQLFSSNGNIFGATDKSTDLYVRVFKGVEDITNQFTDIVWKRTSTDSSSNEEDLNWGNQHAGKSNITIYREDIKEKAMIQVEVYSIVSGERALVAADFITFINVNDMQGSDTPPSSPSHGDMWLDTSMTPPRLMMWDSNLGEWIEITVASKDKRNLIKHSNFYKGNYDSWLSVNSPILKIQSVESKKWAHLKSNIINDDVCGISQTVDAVKKAPYSFQMLSRIYMQSIHPNGDALVSFYSINQAGKKTLIKEEQFDVKVTSKVFTTSFESLNDTVKIEVIIGGQKDAQFDLMVTNIKLENYDIPTEWELAIEDLQYVLDNKLGNSSEEVFNSLTDGGTVQGIYVDTDDTGKKYYYITGTYLDARNLLVRDTKGETTLKIDESGNVTIKATSLSIGSKPVASQDAVNQAVKTVEVLYYLSTSPTELVGGEWSTIAPEWERDKYMWSKTRTTLVDGTISESDATCISGAKGENGAPGEPGAPGAPGPAGTSLKSIDVEYYLSTSKTELTGGSWSTKQPTWVDGTYIWTRNKITYTDNEVSYTQPICDTSWELINGKLDNNQEAIFNKLFANGSQGFVLENGKVYINGEVIKANAISGTAIKAGTFDAGKITTGTLSANVIDANTIVSKVNNASTTINGDKIRTGTIQANTGGSYLNLNNGSMMLGSTSGSSYLQWTGSALNIKASNINIGTESVATDSSVSTAITQLNNSWTAKFNDGYSQGIVTMNKDGITVSSTNVYTKTIMSASGFRITTTNTGKDIFKVNSNGTLSIEGSLYSSSVDSSQTVSIANGAIVCGVGGGRDHQITIINNSGINYQDEYYGDKVIDFRPFENYMSIRMWNNDITLYDDGRLTTNGNRIYHQGFKPSTSDISAIKAVSANGYWGIGQPDGNTSNWIRTTVNGMIPYQSGGSGSLGTSGWPFNTIYAKTYYENGTALSSKYAPYSHTHSYVPTSGGSISANMLKLTGKTNYWTNYGTWSGALFAGNYSFMVVEENSAGRFHFISSSGYPGYVYAYMFTSKARIASSIDTYEIKDNINPFDILDTMQVIETEGRKQVVSKVTGMTDEENIDADYVKTEINADGDIIVTTNTVNMISLLTETVQELKKENDFLRQEIKSIKERLNL